MESSNHADHVFEVSNYSLHRDLGFGSFLRSSTFHAGGCAWCLRFYPCGEVVADHAAVALELLTRDASVALSFDLNLLDEATGARYSSADSCTAELDTRCVEGFTQTYINSEFIKSSDLEDSPFLRGDRLVIECSLRVITATREPDAGTTTAAPLPLPPSELAADMARLLEDGDGADVAFDVDGKSFRAHRIVLAVRTPAFFQAMMLKSPPKDGTMAASIHIHDMKPMVFKAVLHFIYTDCLLQGMEDEASDNGGVETARDLLAAAERFDMGRLKLVCEQILSRSLDVENVAATLVLADRYNCAGLKDACVEFMISNRMDDVARTEGYAVLKTDHPYLLVEALEKAGKLGKL